MSATSQDRFNGLTEEEAKAKRAAGKGNTFRDGTRRSFWAILFSHLFTFFNIVLLGLGLALLLMGQPTDAFFTTAIALTNVVIAVTQEAWARRKLEKITMLVRPRATVIRAGREHHIDPAEIVVGDLLRLAAGDQVAVDGRVVGPGSVDVDESMLTGESATVTKRAGDLLLSGSYCISGRALYEAEKVGAESFANKLTLQARRFKSELTPLQSEVNVVIRVLLVVVIFLGGLLAIRSILLGRPMVENARQASVLFGLAPSSLFLMVVVAYAIGALRMVDKGALVQRINSVESLCHVTMICLDKTGTLTSNRLLLEDVVALNNPSSKEALLQLLGDYAHSVTAPNQTTEALARSCGGRQRALSGEIAFASERKWSGLAFADAQSPGAYILGAPEILDGFLEQSVADHAQLTAWTEQGLRVLMLARSNMELPSGQSEAPPLIGPLTPLCLVSMRDELRPEARETLEGFARAGIQQKIISGDHPQTVAALAQQAGFITADKQPWIVSGQELEAMDEASFGHAAREAHIFGRVTPAQKEKLIQHLRHTGHYVAMTGDGVNDVLALKQANLGIAMQSGSQAARHVADIVLLGDSFAALPETLIEGQRILQGLQDILRLYLTRILYLAFLIGAIAIVDIGFPFTPAQNAMASMLTLSIPGFVLALWARSGPLREESLMRRLFHFVVPATLVTGLSSLAVYVLFIARSQLDGGAPDIVVAQQATTVATVLFGVLLIVFVEPPTRFWVGGDVLSGDWRPTLVAVAMLLLYVLMLIVGPVRRFYGLLILEPVDYALVIGIVLVCAWLLRFIWRRRLLERYLGLMAVGDQAGD